MNMKMNGGISWLSLALLQEHYDKAISAYKLNACTQKGTPPPPHHSQTTNYNSNDMTAPPMADYTHSKIFLRKIVLN